MELSLVAIVGAPNVGKSTLFNRLIGRRRAIVTNEPGVTRDRMYGEVRGIPRPFRLVDTGGLTPNVAAPFMEEIEYQARQAINEAALILFVVDARAGATALDQEIAALLRRSGLPLLLVANKIDSEKAEPHRHELHRLGLGEPLGVSAEHGRGVAELLDSIATILDDLPAFESPRETGVQALNVAIVGRPNVGKSSILNRLVGQERVVVSEIPGTTRDAIDTLLEVEGKNYRLIDTAGIRRRGKPVERTERFSVTRAKQNVAGCDVAVLVIDATEEFAAQDAHIAGMVSDAFKPMLVAVNKWDLMTDREEQTKRWEGLIRDRLKFAKQVPLVLISAKTGQRVGRILEFAEQLHEQAGIQVPTVELNRWLHASGVGERSSPAPRNLLRIYYATQTGVHPPAFTLFCNDPRKVHFSVERRLQNSLRAHFSFGAAPIRLTFRGRRRRSAE